jgi:aminoglycoside phosphotransferase (APT) family kinase protein
MHAEDRPVDAALAVRLARGFVPAVAPVAVAGGTDNVSWRFGDRVARFPRTPGAAAALEREVAWLPRVAPAVPLACPRLRHAGVPAPGYPFAWAVYDWLPGSTCLEAPPEQSGAAPTLAALIGALQALPVPQDAPRMRPGRRLHPEEAFTREMIAAFRPEEGDRGRLSACLDRALALPLWDGPPAWTHGDLHPLNLLSDGTSLTGVIDWGSLNAGDPAQDLICAWTLLDAPARAALRDRLRPDPAAWNRARAFALVMAVQAIPYYRHTNPPFRAAMQQTLRRCLADWPD